MDWNLWTQKLFHEMRRNMSHRKTECEQCRRANGSRVQCKLCKRMICNECWSSKHNSDYCARCQGEFDRVNSLEDK